jgi:hypothetical protein
MMTNSLKLTIELIFESEVSISKSRDVKISTTNTLNSVDLQVLGSAVGQADEEGYDAVLKRSGAGISLHLITRS